jgi:hypothetical protein
MGLDWFVYAQLTANLARECASAQLRLRPRQQRPSRAIISSAAAGPAEPAS